MPRHLNEKQLLARFDLRREIALASFLERGRTRASDPASQLRSCKQLFLDLFDGFAIEMAPFARDERGNTSACYDKLLTRFSQVLLQTDLPRLTATWAPGWRSQIRSDLEPALSARVVRYVDEAQLHVLRCISPSNIRIRRRRRSPRLEEIIAEAREAREAGFNFKEICSRLGDKPRPPGAAWRALSWPEALKEFPGTVKKWLSVATRRNE